MYLWNGIISPTFGLITLNFWQATGLDVFTSYMMPSSNNNECSITETILRGVVKALFILFIGWIIIQNI